MSFTAVVSFAYVHRIEQGGPVRSSPRVSLAYDRCISSTTATRPGRPRPPDLVHENRGTSGSTKQVWGLLDKTRSTADSGDVDEGNLMDEEFDSESDA
ncbi:uncharacterized protein [Aegilops tauschii subsp. strangulata]|uniref:uncharacterized protein n=1 Tax=Aegilops tauschii subsp. strangulata TaxID=200361 RepID=UPI003CC874C9